MAIALGLGLLAAVATSCGATGVKGGLPAARASVIKREIADVQKFVDRGDCQDLNGQLRQVDQEIDNLPASVDAGLVANLRQGSAKLRDSAVQACNTPTTPATTPTTPTTPVETVPTTPTTTETTTTPPDTVTDTIPTTTDVVPPVTTPAATTPAATTPPAATGPGGAPAPDGGTG
jgi:hypothetical protein